MTEQDKFASLELDIEILKLNPNVHSRRSYIRTIITDELLIELYVTNKHTANYICTEIINKKCNYINISPTVILSRLQGLGIQLRKMSEAVKLSDDYRKIKFLEKHGVDHQSKLQAIKEKKKQTWLKTCGYDNIFKSPEFKRKNLEYLTGEINKGGYGQAHATYSLSKPHIEVKKILDDMCVIYLDEQRKGFAGYNPVYEKHFHPRVDIYIPSKKLVIEVNGCYWHADPKKYKSQDVFYTWYGKQTAEDIWTKDKIKENHIKSLGFNYEVIWDDEISTNKVQEILNKYENQENQQAN